MIFKAQIKSKFKIINQLLGSLSERLMNNMIRDLELMNVQTMEVRREKEEEKKERDE